MLIIQTPLSAQASSVAAALTKVAVDGALHAQHVGGSTAVELGAVARYEGPAGHRSTANPGKVKAGLAQFPGLALNLLGTNLLLTGITWPG